MITPIKMKNWFVGLVVWSLCVPYAAGQNDIKERPNIVFIMTDDQSAIVPAPEDAEFDFSDGNGVGVQ